MHARSQSRIQAVGEERATGANKDENRNRKADEVGGEWARAG